MVAKKLGSIYTELGLDTGPLESGQARAEASLRKIETRLDGLSAAVSRATAGIAGALAVDKIVSYGDEWINLSNRMKVVTSESDKLRVAQDSILRIANETRQAVGSTAEVYQRVAQNADALGMNLADVSDVVTTVSKTLAISGASAQAADAAMIQFGQALASGVLRGEELNSVLEQAPALAKALADGLGTTVGQLRAMGAAGQLTSAQVIGALRNQGAAVDEIFARTQSTVAQAVTVLNNSLLKAVGTMSDETGASKALADAILVVANNADVLTQALETGVYVASARVLTASVNYTVQLAKEQAARREAAAAAVQQAQQDLKNAEVSAIAAANDVRAAEARELRAIAAVNAARAEQGAAVVSIQATAAQLAAERQLELVRFEAQINDIGRAKSMSRLAELRLAEAAIAKQVAAAEAALAANTVAGNTAVIEATNARVAAQQRATAAQAALSAASTVGAAANAALARSSSLLATALAGLGAAAGRVLALLGGPVGLALTVGAVALSFVDFSDRADDAKDSLVDLAQPIDQLIAKFEELDKAQRRVVINNLSEQIEKEVGKATASLDQLREMANFSIAFPDANTQSIQNAEEIVNQFISALDDVAAGKKNIDDVTQAFITNMQFGAETRAELEKIAAAYAGTAHNVDDLRSKLDAMTKTIDSHNKALVSKAPLDFSADITRLGISIDNTMKAYKEAEQEVERMAKANQESVKTLQEQAATLGMSASQAAVYKLQMAGASKEQIEAARTAAVAIDAFTNLQKVQQIKNSALPENEAAVARLQERYKELNTIIQQNPELQQQAAEAAAALAQQYQNTLDGQVAAGKAAHEAFLDQMNQRVQAIKDSNATEIDLAIQKYEQDRELVEQAALNDIDNKAKYDQILEDMQAAHDGRMRDMQLRQWSDLNKITKLAWDQQASIVLNTLTSLTAGLSTKSRAMFEINKRASQANVILKGIESVQSSYAAGASIGGPILGAAFAAAAAGFAAVQLSAIESTQFGGGSRGTSAGGSSVPSQATQPGVVVSGDSGNRPTSRIVLEGINEDQLYSGKQVRKLADMLVEFQNDGGVLVPQ